MKNMFINRRIPSMAGLGDAPEIYHHFTDYPIDPGVEQKDWQFEFIQESFELSLTNHANVQTIYQTTLPSRFFHITDIVFSLSQATATETSLRIYSGSRKLWEYFDVEDGDKDKQDFQFALNAKAAGDPLRISAGVTTTISGLVVGWEDNYQWPYKNPMARRGG